MTRLVMDRECEGGQERERERKRKVVGRGGGGLCFCDSCHFF